MIPSAFEYHRPAAMDDAIALLTRHGDTARVMAGGHSLIPVMKLRMSAIDHLVDLQDIAALKGVSVGTTIRIGAMTTQAELINNAALTASAPILREAALQIADPQIRNVGTVGGNVANGDPGNDMPGLMQCLDATYTLAGPKGSRDIPARAFYESAYFTARAEDEILTAITFAKPVGGYAYEKQKRKVGDYATAAAAVQLAASAGRVTSAAIAMTNLSDTPVYSAAAGAALVGTGCDGAAIKAAVTAMLADINPAADNRGPVDFKRHVAGIILGRAITRAFSRA